jgi:hypothetical protein
MLHISSSFAENHLQGSCRLRTRLEPVISNLELIQAQTSQEGQEIDFIVQDGDMKNKLFYFQLFNQALSTGKR